MKYIFIVLLSGFISVSATASEVNKSKIRSCQKIVNQLEHNRDLKRQGGSSSYKNSLRKRRQALDKEYGQRQCYMVKEHLKR